MNPIPPASREHGLEQFRQLLFQLQMQCGSIHEIFHLFQEQESFQHFEALKAIDPNLMTQILAREYVLEARKSPDHENARSHLETALQLDPACAEALFELATISDTPETSMKWLNRCMEYTLDHLGKERLNQLLNEFKHNPWHQAELHTYLKAKVSLAEKLFREGYYEVAILHFKEMLEWNPSDDINIRHFLMVALLCEDRLTEAQSLKLEFANDLSAQWFYARAFLHFKMEGESPRANRLLMRAFKRNLWASIYALGLQEMPAIPNGKNSRFQVPLNGNLFDILPSTGVEAFKEGGREEAVDCVRCIAPVILEDPKLAEWVWVMLKALV